jgi:hypothetical protein
MKLNQKKWQNGLKLKQEINILSNKSSCISDDIKSIQDSPDLTNAFNGKRVKRGLFLDVVINKVFNADINAAVNHIKVAVGRSFDWLKDRLFKLCNPIKIKSDYEFCRLINSLWNSGSGKSVPFIGAEALQSDKLIGDISFC